MAVRRKHTHHKPAKRHRQRGMNLADREPRRHRILFAPRKFLTRAIKPAHSAAPIPKPRPPGQNGAGKVAASGVPNETDRNDRSTYDSDTAIKLYLREIGQ